VTVTVRCTSPTRPPRPQESCHSEHIHDQTVLAVLQSQPVYTRQACQKTISVHGQTYLVDCRSRALLSQNALNICNSSIPMQMQAGCFFPRQLSTKQQQKPPLIH
jgi:hypothetical protein